MLASANNSLGLRGAVNVLGHPRAGAGLKEGEHSKPRARGKAFHSGEGARATGGGPENGGEEAAYVCKAGRRGVRQPDRRLRDLQALVGVVDIAGDDLPILAQ